MGRVVTIAGNGDMYARIVADDDEDVQKKKKKTRTTDTSHGTSHGFVVTDASLQLVTPAASSSALPDVWGSVVREKYDVVKDADGIRVGTCGVDRRLLEQHGASMMHRVDVQTAGVVSRSSSASAPADSQQIVHVVVVNEKDAGMLIPPSVRIEEPEGGRSIRFGVTGAWSDGDKRKIVAEVSMFMWGSEEMKTSSSLPVVRSEDVNVALESGDDDDDRSRTANFVVDAPPGSSRRDRLVLYVLTITHSTPFPMDGGDNGYVAATHVIRDCMTVLSNSLRPSRVEEDGDWGGDIVAGHDSAWSRRFGDANHVGVSGEEGAISISDHVVTALYYVLVTPAATASVFDDEGHTESFVERVCALVWPSRARLLARNQAFEVLRGVVYATQSSHVDRRNLERAASVVLTTWDVFRVTAPASLPWLHDEAYPEIIAPLLADAVWNAPLPSSEDPGSPYLSATVMLALQVGAEAREVTRGKEGTDAMGRSWLRTRDAWAVATDRLHYEPDHLNSLRVHACEGRRDILRTKCPRTFSAMHDVDAAIDAALSSSSSTPIPELCVMALGIPGRRDARSLDRAFTILSAHPPPDPASAFSETTTHTTFLLGCAAYLFAFLIGICGVRIAGRLHRQSVPYGVRLLKEGRTVLPRDIDSISLRLAALREGRGKNNDHPHRPRVIRNNRTS